MLRLPTVSLILALLAPAAAAQAPEGSEERAPARLAYTGLLTAETGEPVPDGPYTLTFRLYATADASGPPLWTGTREVVVSGGRFSTLLDAEVPEAQSGFLTVQVGDAPASAAVALSAPGENALGGTLQDAYAAGNVITTSSPPGAVNIRGTEGQIALRIDDGDLFFNSNVGTAVQRFRSGQSGQVWQLRAYGTPPTGSPGRFAIRDVTNGGGEPFTVYPGAAGGLVSLAGSQLFVGLGSATSFPQNGRIGVYRSDMASSVVDAYTTSAGGAIALRGPSGSNIVNLGLIPGFAGPLFALQWTDGLFLLESVSGGGNGPSLSLSGPSSGFSFDSESTGDAALQVPASGVNAVEILNEAGAASANGAGSVTLTGGEQVVAFRTLTAPTSGYVVAVASGELSSAHVNGAATETVFALSDDCEPTPTYNAFQDRSVLWAASVPSGTLQTVVGSTALFSVGAGGTTFCIIANEVAGESTLSALNLSLLFVPTAYGSVNSTEPAGDLAAEQARAAVASEQRVQSELAAMRAEMARMRSQMRALVEAQAQVDDE